MMTKLTVLVLSLALSPNLVHSQEQPTIDSTLSMRLRAAELRIERLAGNLEVLSEQLDVQREIAAASLDTLQTAMTVVTVVVMLVAGIGGFLGWRDLRHRVDGAVERRIEESFNKQVQTLFVPRFEAHQHEWDERFVGMIKRYEHLLGGGDARQ